MRDLLEELLALPEEEDEQEILEQLLRQAGTGTGRGAALEEGDVPENFPQKWDENVEKIPTRPSAEPEQREDKRDVQAEQGWKEQLNGEEILRLEQELMRFGRSVSTPWQEHGARRAEREAELTWTLHRAPALAQQLERSVQAAVRASARTAGANTAAQTRTDVLRTPVGETEGGVKRIDRAFERDARRYDGRFYLY